MEEIFAFATQHMEWALWVFCGLILLAGLNIPISEDIVLLSAGAFVGTQNMGSPFFHYFFLFLACWIAAWEAYWIGRLLGPSLYRISWFSWLINPERIKQLHYYYEKFGILTFFVGRFIPGGVRNCLFMSSGLGKMPFFTFILRDLPGCFLSAAILFYVGFLFGQHIEIIFDIFKTYSLLIISFFVLSIFFILKWCKYTPHE